MKIMNITFCQYLQLNEEFNPDEFKNIGSHSDRDQEMRYLYGKQVVITRKFLKALTKIPGIEFTMPDIMQQQMHNRRAGYLWRNSMIGTDINGKGVNFKSFFEKFPELKPLWNAMVNAKVEYERIAIRNWNNFPMYPPPPKYSPPPKSPIKEGIILEVEKKKKKVLKPKARPKKILWFQDRTHWHNDLQFAHGGKFTYHVSQEQEENTRNIYAVDHNQQACYGVWQGKNQRGVTFHTPKPLHAVKHPRVLIKQYKHSNVGSSNIRK